jgi:hypothetical protein
VKLLNDTLKLLRRMNLYECYMYLNNDGYDAIYCENVSFMNVYVLLMMMDMMRHIV